MNIVGIVGSLRKDSIHRIIFNHYRTLCSDLFTLEEATIKNIPMYDGENMDNPRVRELSEDILNADGIIFFTPEYNYSIPGSLKNTIDWMSRCDPQPFNYKPATIIGASPGNIGTARMQYHLRQVGVFLNLHFMNKPEVMISGSKEKIRNKKIADDSTIDFLQLHAKAFSKYVLQS